MCSSTRSEASQSAATSTPGSRPMPGERLGESLAGDAVERQRERIDRARDQLRAGAGGRERRGERAAAGALHVDPDRQPARLGERADELLRPVRLQRAGRVVQEDAHRAELGQQLRPLDQRVDLAGPAGAVDETRPRSRAPRRRSPRRPRAGSRRRSADRAGGRRRCRSRPPTRRSGARSPRRPAASRRGSGRAARARAASSPAP